MPLSSRTSAPQARRKPARSPISGSFAALQSTVSPSQRSAASSRFSVAPTLGKPSAIVHGAGAGSSQIICSPRSSICAPMRRRPARWRSIGRAPSTHPPGNVIAAFPNRASRAPRKITAARIRRIRQHGISKRLAPVLSTVTVAPHRSASHPRCRRISSAVSTSLMAGQFVSVQRPETATVAARMGRTLFFAPWIAISPRSGRPPLI